MTASISFEVDRRTGVVKVPNSALRFFPLPRYVRSEDKPLVEGKGPDQKDDEQPTEFGLSAEERKEARQKRTLRHVWVQEGTKLRAVEVRTGLFRRRLLLLPVEEVADIEPRQKRIILRCLEAGKPCGFPGRDRPGRTTLARRTPREVRGERIDEIDDHGGVAVRRQIRRRTHELRVRDVEAVRRPEPRDGGRAAPPRVEQHLEGTRVADERAGERRHGPEHPEPHDDEAHAERLDLRPQGRGRRTREQRTARDLVGARQQPQVMVGADLVAPPRRHRETGHEEEHLHAASHRLVVTAWRQMPSVAPRR